MGREVNVSTFAGNDHNRWLDANAVDPGLRPLDQMIEFERNDHIVRVFLTGCLPWDNVTRTCCPVCKGLPKPQGWYCGRCDTPKGTQARTARKVKAGKEDAPLKVKVLTRKEKRRAKERKAA